MPEFILNDKDTREFQQLPEITQGFIEAMFFTECDGSVVDGTFDPEIGSQLPDEASWLEISDESLQVIIDVTTHWAKENAADLQAAYDYKDGDEHDYNEVRAGHDLWYTSNHHGVGFWDRGFPDGGFADRLTKAAHDFGETNVYWETTDEETGEGIVYVD